MVNCKRALSPFEIFGSDKHFSSREPPWPPGYPKIGKYRTWTKTRSLSSKIAKSSI